LYPTFCDETKLIVDGICKIFYLIISVGYSWEITILFKSDGLGKSFHRIARW